MIVRLEVAPCYINQTLTNVLQWTREREKFLLKIHRKKILRKILMEVKPAGVKWLAMVLLSEIFKIPFATWGILRVYVGGRGVVKVDRKRTREIKKIFLNETY